MMRQQIAIILLVCFQFQFYPIMDDTHWLNMDVMTTERIDNRLLVFIIKNECLPKECFVLREGKYLLHRQILFIKMKNIFK